MARKKIGLIGAGNIGGELANLAATKQLGDVILFDIPAKEKFAQGKALDLEQSTAVSGSDAKVTGTSNWEDLAGVDVLIITAVSRASRGNRVTTSSARTCPSSRTSPTTPRSIAQTHS